MAMGEVLNLNNVGSLYVMAPNYAAGKNMVAGVTRTFKGKIVGKDLTKWGKDAQLDFSAELAKAKASGAEGILFFILVKQVAHLSSSMRKPASGKNTAVLSLHS